MTTPPTTPPIMNGMDIAETAAAIRRLLDDTTAAIGISSADFIPMRIIAIRGPLNPAELHDFVAKQLLFGLRPENAADLLASLEERGLLSGTSRDGDGPAQMTEAGRAVFDKVAVSITEVSDKLYVVCEHEDLVTATRVMARLTERAKELAAG